MNNEISFSVLEVIGILAFAGLFFGCLVMVLTHGTNGFDDTDEPNFI